MRGSYGEGITSPGGSMLLMGCGALGVICYLIIQLKDRNSIEPMEVAGAFGFGSVVFGFLLGVGLFVADLIT